MRSRNDSSGCMIIATIVIAIASGISFIKGCDSILKEVPQKFAPWIFFAVVGVIIWLFSNPNKK